MSQHTLVSLVAVYMDLRAILGNIAAEADQEAKNIGASARRGDQSKAATFRFIRDQALRAIAKMEGK